MRDEEIHELLPWYANGSLSPEENRLVESYLARVPAAAAELRQWNHVGALVRDTAGEPGLLPGNLNVVMAEIDRFEREKTEQAEQGGVWQSIVRSLWAPLPMLARAAMVAQFALVIALGAALLAGPRGEAEFGTASGPPGVVATTGALIHLKFAPETPESSIRAILAELGEEARIVSGPSRQAIYTVEVPLDPSEVESVKALVAELMARDEIVYAARRPGS